ncbi:MAG: hypothetical protein QG559_893 [Campylobacterota bacterium]|nr:hypothetical protein [Campylobacterota bacterium]
MKKNVVVIGGGYGGLRAIEFLAKREEIEITLIDKNPYHYMQTEAYGYIAGRFDLHDVVVDLEDWCSGFEKKVHFVYDEVISMDFDARMIQTCNGAVAYDYLILAMGAKTNFFSFIDGLREHSFGVKNLQRAHSFRVEFERIIYEKLQNQSNEQEINLAIGGAGLSGVEVAAEMAHIIQAYGKTIGLRAKNIKIYLIDASATILPQMSAFLIQTTQKRLESLGVEILINTFIDRIDEEYIYFKNEQKLKYCFMIFTGGIRASSLNDTIDVPKNKIAQLMPNKDLTIGSMQNVFAIGDCVEIRDNKGDILPPTAQTAERSAEYVAKTIIAKMDNRKYKNFDASVLGVFIALGGRYCAGELFGIIKVNGYIAYLLKKAITQMYALGLHLRINTGYKNRIKKPY